MSAARRILYLCPWVDVGGSDRNTIDLLAALDRARFHVVLATTLPSRNRGLARAAEHVEEVWPLPDLMPGRHFASSRNFRIRMAAKNLNSRLRSGRS